MRLWITALLTALSACGHEPSHIPNPLLLPAQAVSTAIENTHYNARRTQVKRYVTENWETLLEDIRRQTGPTLTEAMSLAHIKAAKRPALILSLIHI